MLETVQTKESNQSDTKTQGHLNGYENIDRNMFSQLKKRE